MIHSRVRRQMVVIGISTYLLIENPTYIYGGTLISVPQGSSVMYILCSNYRHTYCRGSRTRQSSVLSFTLKQLLSQPEKIPWLLNQLQLSLHVHNIPAVDCQFNLSTPTSLQRATLYGNWQNLQVSSLYCCEDVCWIFNLNE